MKSRMKSEAIDLDLKRKVWKLPLVIWLILEASLTSMVTGAIVYELNISGHVTITPTPVGEYSVQAFQDAACTTPLTDVDWGSLQAGQYKAIPLYVKNNGTQAITSITVRVLSDIQNGGGTTRPVMLEPGQSVEVDAILSVKPDASPGDYSITIEITCTA